MPNNLNGLIDGSAPPFILLVFVMGAMYHASSILKDTGQVISGVKFKPYARRIIYVSMLLFFLLGLAIIIRIMKNGFSTDNDFRILDVFILAGILCSYILLVINTAVLYGLKRKYIPEVGCPITLPKENNS